MGSGKTTVGRLLADLAGYDFLDLDDLIVTRAGKSIDAIFVEHGEDEFRRLERDAVASLRGLERTVVALGGGTYTFSVNRDRISLIGKTVWLDSPLDLCLSRTEGDGTRPLLRDKESLGPLFDERRNSYRLADYVFNAGSDSPDQVAFAIASMLRREGLLE
ncbi:MAG TPA: shikimate kinase [Blastocatellia bacterium]|nr:shikimate kinase [Blastocatellia bacterium]